MSVDVGVTLDGFVADSAYTFPVGDVSPEAELCSRRARRPSQRASSSAGSATASATSPTPSSG